MKKIDTTHWGKFKIDDLFKKLDLKIIKSDFNKKLDVSETKNDEFSLPLVNAKHFNNGIMYYGREADFETAEMTIDIVKNGAIATGDVFAQPQKTGVLWDAYLIKPKEKINSDLVLLFLSTVLRKTIKDKFSYDDKCIWVKVKTLDIYLPVTEAGNPDFTYMESYMRNLESAVSSSLTALRSAKNSEICNLANTPKWSVFTIGQVFPKIVKPQVYHTREVKQNDNGIPYVVRSKFNNGIKYLVSKPNGETNPAKVISFGAENATFFYQEEEWISGRDMYYIDTTDIDKYACLFITACLQPIATKYSYNFGLFPDLLRKEKVKLPVDNNGNIDYTYMSTYMRTLENESKTKINQLKFA